MGRTTKRLNIRAKWDTEYSLYLMYHEGATGMRLAFGRTYRLAQLAVLMLKDLPGPVDMKRRAG